MTRTVIYIGCINASLYVTNVAEDASGNILSKRLKSSSFVSASTQKMERNPNITYIKINFAYSVLRILFHLKFVTDSPHSAKAPSFVVFNFLTKAFDVNVYRAGVPNVFISPNTVKQLVSCKYLIW